jgi:O-antigen/teichoic acid export membrane protein
VRKGFIRRYTTLPKEVKASIWFLICSVLQKGISVITVPIFTRLLSSSEYGLYNVYNSWLGIITVFVTLSLYNGVYMQGLVKYEEERSIFTSSLQGLTFTLIVIWLLIYLLFPSFWNELLNLSSAHIFLMFTMMWASAVFCFWATEQRVLLNYKKLVIVSLLVSFAKPTLSLILVCISSNKVVAWILGISIVEVVGYGWMFFKHMQEGRVFFSPKYWKYAISFSLPLIPHYLAQNILVSSDRIMIERMSGLGEAGIYSLAYSIAQLMLLFNTALIQTISPWMFRKIKNREEDQISNIAYISLAIVAAMNILLIAIAPEAVKVFAPSTYYDAIWVIPPISVSVFFMYCYSLFVNFEFYYEKTGFIATATLISAVLNLILNYFFIPQFGYKAAGYTTLFCYFVQALSHYFFMDRICKKEFAGKIVFKKKPLLLITLILICASSVFMLTYRAFILRYSFIIIIILFVYIKRKMISKALRSIIEIRNVHQ